MNMTRFELKNRIGSILFDMMLFSRKAYRRDLKGQWWFPINDVEVVTDWQRLCCYKLNDSWEGDCDVSLRSMVSYALALGLREKWHINRQIKSAMNYQLELRHPPKSKAGRAAEYVLRGDTMNSYATTMHAYLDLRDKDKKVNPKGECWEILALREDTAEEVKKLLSPAAHEFVAWVHTIGNMLPVPYQAYAPDTEDGRRAAFNAPRYAKTKDYFDLTLLCLYAYFTDDSDGVHTMEWLLANKEDRAMSQRWLDSFGKDYEGWTRFVEQNLLQDSVNQRKEGGWGKPKELWKGHFRGAVLPKRVEQCEEFFTNASAWVQARGVRMDRKVKEQFPLWEYLRDEKMLKLAKSLLPEVKSEGEV